MPIPMQQGMGGGLPQGGPQQGPPPQQQTPNPMQVLMEINQKIDKLAQLIMTIAKGDSQPPMAPPGQMR